MKKSTYGLLVLLSIGLVLPAATLSWLGARSFRYEQLLLQKQNEERYGAMADALQRRASELIAGWIGSLQSVADSTALAERVPETLVPQLLTIHHVASLPVRTLWLIENDDRLISPIQTGAQTSVQPVVLDWGSQGAEIDRLEHLEISNHRVAEALQGYQALVRENLSKQQHIELIKMIAADDRQLGQTAAAEQLYTDLKKNDDQEPDVSGYPTGLIAMELLGALYNASHQEVKAYNARLDLFESLLCNHWSLPETAREKWLDQTNSNLQRLQTSQAGVLFDNNRWHSLLALRQRLDTLKPNAVLLMTRDWPVALHALRERGTLEKGDLVVLNPAESLLIAPAHGDPSGLLIAVIDSQAIFAAWTETLNDLAKSSGLSVHWTLTALNNSRLSPQDRQVEALWPGLRLSLQIPSNTTEEAFAHRRMKLYAWMIGLSSIVLLVGLSVMIMAIRKEIKVAHLKSEFVSNLSHQIRTPLYAITHISERLEMGRYRSNEEVESFYTMLREEAERLRDLVDQALNFSKLVDGRLRLTLSRVDLREVAVEAIEACRRKAETRGVTVTSLTSSMPIWVDADRKSIIQAAINLLDNAIKYSADSKTIAVSVECQNQAAHLLVRDEGLGIPLAEQTKIFEKFYRVEDAAARTADGGVGLGLAIVREIVQAHQGSVSVQSIPGQGSVFTMTLPLASADEQDLSEA